MNSLNTLGWTARAIARSAVVILPIAMLSACAPTDGESEAPTTADDALGDNSTYAQTKYPIVLCHGMAGFSSLFGVIDYFHDVDSTLTAGGATVFLTHVSQFNSTEQRGEALLSQIEDILARTGAQKVNLIGHSHGGLDARYVAAARPDLVASVTTVGTPHQGAELATYLKANLREGGFTKEVIVRFANDLGKVLGILSGNIESEDARAALDSLSASGAAAFNAKLPTGLPDTPCGQGPAEQNGIRFYSWSGTDPFTNAADVGDALLKLASTVYTEPSDGVVGQCSSHFGTVIRDNFKMNHLDEVNQVLGITSPFETNPKTVYRNHANRLKNDGL
jgi:triacylglycerol lipase